MRTRSFLFGALPVLCGLFAAALFLPGCDSGADFSSLEAIAPNDDLTAKARAWYAEQVELEVSDRLSKAEGDEDSLALLSFIEKFPPDWNESVVLSLDGTEETLVLATTLGKYTDERYDSVMYHVRTLVMDMEPSGDVVSGHVIAFSSDEKLSKENFTDYVERYVAKDFAGMKMTVSRYTIMFEDVDSYFYSPGNVPLELSMYLSKKKSLGKNFKIDMNKISTPNGPCYILCQQVIFGEICANEPAYVGQPYGAASCSPRFRTFCSDFCYPSSGGNGGGSSGGGGGGVNDDNSDENNDEEKCSCSDKTKCIMEKEYKNPELYKRSWTPTCNDIQSFSANYNISPHFKWSEFNDNWSGNGSQHKPYGIVDSWIIGVLEDLRSAMGGNSMRLEGGYRCPHGNKSVGGKLKSYHMIGKAADIDTPDEVYWDRLYNVVTRRDHIDFPGKKTGRDAAYNYYGGGIFHVEPQ